MSARTTITSDNLVETMTELVGQGVKSLTAYARLLPAFYAEAPWKDETDKDGKTVTMADFTRETFGIGASRDGYVTLPQIALDAAIESFVEVGVKLTYAEITALTGASRATAARASAKGGMSAEQPQKDPTKGNSDKSDNAGTPGSSESAQESEGFDLSALLSALDDSELKSVLSKVGLDRVRKVIA